MSKIRLSDAIENFRAELESAKEKGKNRKVSSALQVMLTKESNPIKGVLIDSRATIDTKFRLSYSQ
jgi:hypothetical protein